jgi:hypothetical protein
LPVTRNADLDFTNATNGVAVNVRKADLRPASDLGNYQRVTTQYDVTEAGVPSCSYLFFDGGSDSMATGNIDFTATDKMTTFAGIRGNSAGAQVVAELSATSSANAGSFLIGSGSFVSGGNRIGGQLAGSTLLGYDSPATFAPPLTSIITNAYNIAGTTALDEAGLRIDAIVQSPLNAGATGSAGTGNFGNYPLYLGFRSSGATLYFNGNLFGLIVRGAASTTAQITDTEQWLAPKSTFFKPLITGIPTVGVS